MAEITVKALPIKGFHEMQILPDDKVALVLSPVQGEAMALVLPPSLADEVAGALVERPVSKKLTAALAPKASQMITVDHHAVSEDGDGTFVLSLRAEDGTMQVFKMGVQRARRLRDTLSALIARNLIKKKH